jgi:hypothetical protein
MPLRIGAKSLSHIDYSPHHSLSDLSNRRRAEGSLAIPDGFGLQSSSLSCSCSIFDRGRLRRDGKTRTITIPAGRRRSDMIPCFLARPGAALFWLAVVLTGIGAGLLTGGGQILLGHLSSSNGIDITAAVWFHGGRLPTLRTLGSALLSVLIVGMGCRSVARAPRNKLGPLSPMSFRTEDASLMTSASCWWPAVPVPGWRQPTACLWRRALLAGGDARDAGTQVRAPGPDGD